ncbi:NAD-dependent epimerase [Nitratidesulfovibrio sp. HK-II]|uniref:NAD-dependent epimerase n=1 Tax=Nitratidesulfovibrio sp. HK-II TaxID=2009266 RepID=UPI000E2F7824|nr:NAD-dependent epimerase [Nitratidesulfovibrio sp. HK-II]GBO97463.1 UDP-glucose 4-epimerase [Nitratidesulfovibrio sp. HK-II]
MHILVTGAAGFIGFHLSRRFLEAGHTVVGLDCLNDYYDVQLKKDRLKELEPYAGFTFAHMDMADDAAMDGLFEKQRFTHVVNLAAQAGVRYSLKNPRSYIQSNLVGFGNILEGCRHNGVQHLVYASSSSVYGLNTAMPFSVHHNVDHPISLYAASKKANELMAHTYSHLYRLPTTGLRFFTVYGPWGRPDMALYLFTKAILEGKPINVFNEGRMRRDFTYIDDIVEGVVRVTERTPQPNPEWRGDAPDPSTSPAPYRIYNIGNNNAVELGRFIEILEDALGRKAVRNLMPMQPGDVEATYADVDDLIRDTGFKPHTPLEKGVGEFVRWFRDYYKV